MARKAVLRAKRRRVRPQKSAKFPESGELRHMRTLLATCAICLTAAWSALCSASEPPRRTFELELHGKRIEGMPLAWSPQEIDLLERDGRLLSFSPHEAANYRQSSSSFQCYPASVLRSRLAQDLGKGFEVTSTGHYLVAHPAGDRVNWSQRFEDLYRSFAIYFSVRGFNIKNPEFPLIAVVYPNQQEFMRAAAAEGSGVTSDVLGFYSQISNRIMLYDHGGGNGNSADWQQNAATIIHEATHQTAFNTGIHRRFAVSPRWLVEGLGTMFEAPGVWDSRAHPGREDRINRGRFEQFRQHTLPRWKPGALQSLVGSDRIFDADAQAAYSEAWALSFFLIETQPRKYCDYLALTAKRPVFETYSSAQRLADFTSIFGGDFRMLEARFLRFMAELK
jgi:Protein of unknown function (DUF1570)